MPVPGQPTSLLLLFSQRFLTCAQLDPWTESSQGGDDASMGQCQHQQVCLSPSSCLNILIPLSGEMVGDAQYLDNGKSL